MAKGRSSKEEFIQAAKEAADRRYLQEIFGITAVSISSRLNRMVENGILVKDENGEYYTTGGEVLFHGDKHASNESQHRVAPGYKSRVNQDQIGGDGNHMFNIDTSGSEKGARYMKDPDTLERIDGLMSLMKDSDSEETKTMFRELAFKIFKDNMK